MLRAPRWLGIGPGPVPWGDGIVEQSLTTLLYARTWSGVDEDELVYYIPALHSPAALAALRPDEGPLPLLRRVRLSAQVCREIDTIALFDRAIADARWLYDPGVGAPVHRSPADAAIVSALSGVNAIYLYPDLLHLAETLTAAAWLAVPLTGRPALLPPSIAHRLTQAVRGRTGDYRGDVCDRILAEYCARAFGLRRAERKCAAVVRNGYPVVMRPLVHS